MTINGYDYSFWRPSSASDLAGVQFVVRYLSPDPSKNLTLAEAQQLTSWGLLIVSNWESSGQGGSYGQGASDAQSAISQATACGMPSGYPIYFSIDEDVDPSTQAAYFQGIASIIPVAQIGVYGSAAMVQYMVSSGLAKWGWRTMSTDWTGGSSTQDAQLVQVNFGLGGNVDTDYADASNFGGWQVGGSALGTSTPPPVPVPAPVPTTSEEDDMQQVEPLSVHPGLYNFPTINKSHFRLTVGDGGIANVRVVAWSGAGALVLCGDNNDGDVPKGFRDFNIDSATNSHVTVERKDTGNFPVGAVAY
jgi:hypothetical protein